MSTARGPYASFQHEVIYTRGIDKKALPQRSSINSIL